MNSKMRIHTGAKGRLALIAATVACLTGVGAPAAMALNPQPLPPGRSPIHATPPNPCSVAASGRC